MSESECGGREVFGVCVGGYKHREIALNIADCSCKKDRRRFLLAMLVRHSRMADFQCNGLQANQKSRNRLFNAPVFNKYLYVLKVS